MVLSSNVSRPDASAIGTPPRDRAWSSDSTTERRAPTFGEQKAAPFPIERTIGRSGIIACRDQRPGSIERPEDPAVLIGELSRPASAKSSRPERMDLTASPIAIVPAAQAPPMVRFGPFQSENFIPSAPRRRSAWTSARRTD